MSPPIRQKVRFVVADLKTAVYEGGPSYRPEYSWNEDGLLVGEDRVAVDTISTGIVERKRAEKGLQTLEQKGTPMTYLTTAADAQHKLGTNELARITLIEQRIV
jgi:xanthine/CO dehydrogenase XdhC/CoxF family maturation factor